MAGERSFLFVSDHLGGGGAPISILNLAEALAGRGHDVTIAVLSDKVWREIPEGVIVKKLPLEYENIWQKFWRFRRHAKEIDNWLEETGDDYDVVIANLYYTHQVVIHSSLADRAWLCARTDPVQMLLSKRVSNFKIKHKIKKIYGGRRVLAISHGILESISRYGCVPQNAKVIHNIIDADFVRERMRQDVEVKDYIVAVGRLGLRQKRYDRLLRAYKKSGIARKLVFVGDGEIEKAKALVHDLELDENVVFLGQKANPYPYIHHADLLVLASDYEGFGRVIAESLICGTPVVSTDCPSGPRDILTGELASCLVETNDEAALARKLREVLEAPPVIRPEHYERFSPDVIAHCYETLAG
ncbi:glycosyltransferase involved in cell wall biosynthesis [Chromohalobacter marismortui]|uniref:Glycosyltransferase involved in cell wall biosynthesis n=1 Tax=Chromohalobacter marismortui TaxID=42055 RepID=A0A4V3F4F9_9GAMM|nr:MULTISPECIES: glycosyltransferase [Chromohalobacter]MCI0510270.1 glycosyltransferase [Chromohalobacter sp.]TDU25156.1 glycosyltransferase involved in cell wall biosynthesis [Chromohalobacter marismortui]